MQVVKTRIETRCSNCGKLINEWQRFCTNCGDELNSDNLSRITAIDFKYHCNICRTDIMPGQVYCHNCGAELALQEH